MLTRRLHLLGDIVRSNATTLALPYKVTFVATYHCNFRCEMCGIWQKKSVNEMTPDEVARFFTRWSQFSWVHLTGGELFMRRDLDDLIAAIQRSCRSLFLLNFPTTGWFGNRVVEVVEKTLARGVGRLMVTISIDGPPKLHEELRGLPNSWARGIDTFQRLRGIKRNNFQPVIGMTLLKKNAAKVEETFAAIQAEIPDFKRSELHLNIGHDSEHYFANNGREGLSAPDAEIVKAMEAHRRQTGGRLHPVKFLEDRYQALVSDYLRTHTSPLPCTAMASSCFIDPYWTLYPCSIWNEPVGNLREADFDLQTLWLSEAARHARQNVVSGNCPHCWTPCEAYPTILGNLGKAAMTHVAR